MKQSGEGIWKGFQVKLGDGDANWPAVNAALKEVGYQGWGSAEVRGGDRVRLQEISERMDRLLRTPMENVRRSDVLRVVYA